MPSEEPREQTPQMVPEQPSIGAMTALFLILVFASLFYRVKRVVQNAL